MDNEFKTMMKHASKLKTCKAKLQRGKNKGQFCKHKNKKNGFCKRHNDMYKTHL